jgi:hypothetical protein
VRSGEGQHKRGPWRVSSKHFFQSNRLIDIQPERIVPTWRNGRTGADSIAKRLDRILISEDILNSVGLYRSWVEYPFVSDHAPVLLQLEITPLYKAYPFKLNSQWLYEKDFNSIVHKVWNDQKYLSEGGKTTKVNLETKRTEGPHKTLGKGKQVSGFDTSGEDGG